jgi:hypothetical protein
MRSENAGNPRERETFSAPLSTISVTSACAGATNKQLAVATHPANKYVRAFGTPLACQKKPIHDEGESPNICKVFCQVARAKSSEDSFRTPAIASIIKGIKYEEFVLPRYGMGVKKGASVSTNNWSSGTTCKAARKLSEFLNVTLPANEM